MRNIHFYKAHSRLGLLNLPYGSTEVNVGVEEGPDAILTPDFLKDFGNPAVNSYNFSPPEKIDKTQYQDIIAREYGEFSDQISTTIKAGESQVVIGGDHSVTFSSYLALAHRINPKDVAYIQFDSHADIHSFTSSPSGNFHGMYVKAFVDDVASPQVQNLITKKLPVKNLLYIGNHVNEKAEWDFLNSYRVSVISRRDLLSNGVEVHKRIEAFAHARRHLHISFDVDIFDKSITPATGILVDDGFFPEDVFPILEILSSHPSLSIDLVEVNPKKPGATSTIKLAQKILRILLS